MRQLEAIVLMDLKNLISSAQIRSIGLYMYLWTAMMTIHWITSIQIINSWSSDGGDRIIFLVILSRR